MNTSAVEKNSAKAWLLAARPKTLSGAAVPVVMAAALAFRDGSERILPAVLALLFAFLMQIDANFINDLFDFLKGSDGKDRLGPKRACAEGWVDIRSMKIAIGIVTLLACLTGSLLLFYGGLWLLVVGAACVLFAFLYTAGPYPLAYHGAGDLLVLVFFGIVPVCCTYYVMCGAFTPASLAAGLSSGFVIDTLLIVNNIRDIEQDRKNGKTTLTVLLGKDRSRSLYLCCGFAAAGLCAFLVPDYGWIPFAFPLLYIPLHVLSWRKLKSASGAAEYNALLGETSGHIVLFGIFFLAGIALSVI